MLFLEKFPKNTMKKNFESFINKKILCLKIIIENFLNTHFKVHIPQKQHSYASASMNDEEVAVKKF